jgi:uncharacterized protein with NRDE domain
VYSTLRSASEYLQAEGLDYLSAWNMVEKAKEVLKNLNFENIMKTTTKIIEAVNQMFDDDDEETDFAIEACKYSEADLRVLYTRNNKKLVK